MARKRNDKLILKRGKYILSTNSPQYEGLTNKWREFIKKDMEEGENPVNFFNKSDERASIELLIKFIESYEGYPQPYDSPYEDSWNYFVESECERYLKENKEKIFTPDEIDLIDSLKKNQRMELFAQDIEENLLNFNSEIAFDYNVFLRMDQFVVSNIVEHPEDEKEKKAKVECIKVASKILNEKAISQLFKDFFQKHSEGESFGGIVINANDLLKFIQKQEDIKSSTAIFGLFDHYYYGDDLYGGGVWTYGSYKKPDLTLKIKDFSKYDIDTFIGKGLETAPFEMDVEIDWKYNVINFTKKVNRVNFKKDKK